MDKEGVVYIYTMEYYSAIKKSEVLPFATTLMDVETVIQSEVSQKEKNKCHMLTHIYGISKKNRKEKKMVRRT